MLYIEIPESELWDEANEQFLYSPRTNLSMEHSLVSISKWEAKYKIPFLSQKSFTKEQEKYYFKCMTLTQNVHPIVYDVISNSRKYRAMIFDYINDSPTATFIPKRAQTTGRSKEPVTSELIYYWMVSLQIPFECQKWHLNRLLMLVNVCGFKNQPNKKLSKKEAYSRNAAINAANRAKFHSKG